jgi:hypothetical protein
MNLAVVISTCDKHSFLWEGWWYYFNKNWKYDYPVYFLNEKKNIDFPIKEIKVDITDINLWTKKIRESIKQIPEDDIFWLCEDFFIIKKFKENEFENIYQAFKKLNADSMTIRRDKSKYTTTHKTKTYVNTINVLKLDQYSEYLISYSPNIWKKSFLLECLKYDESPWDSEIKGSRRIEGKGYNIYSYLKKDWYGNACRNSKITDEGKILINESRSIKS